MYRYTDREMIARRFAEADQEKPCAQHKGVLAAIQYKPFRKILVEGREESRPT